MPGYNKMFQIPISRATVRQFRNVIPVLCGSLLYGFGNGWSGSSFYMLTSKNCTVKATVADISLSVSLCYIGNLVAVFYCLASVNNCSRKLLIFLNLGLNVVSWTISLIATDVQYLFLSASICGLACGIYDINTHNYLSEVCTPSNRSFFGALSLVCYIFATELSFVLAVFDSLLVLSAVPLVISVLALLTWSMTEESPYYLATNGRTEESYRVLTYLNDKIEEKLYHEEMVKYCQEDHSTGFLTYLKEPENSKLCFTVVVINTMLYTSSFAVFIGYGHTLLSYFNLNLDKVKYTILAAFLIFALLSFATLNIFSSRSQICVGFAMLTIIQLCLGVLFSVAESYNYRLQYIGQAIITCGILYFWVYLLTVYPAVHVLRSEIFPPKLKEKGSCILVILKTAVEFLVSVTFFPVVLAAGIEFNFYIYTTCAAVGALFAYRFLKETRGKTFVEIWNDYRG